MLLSQAIVGNSRYINNACLDKATQNNSFMISKSLDGHVQTLGNVVRVKKSTQNHSLSARLPRTFLNSQNISACLGIKLSKKESIKLLFIRYQCFCNFFNVFAGCGK